MKILFEKSMDFDATHLIPLHDAKEHVKNEIASRVALSLMHEGIISFREDWTGESINKELSERGMLYFNERWFGHRMTISFIVREAEESITTPYRENNEKELLSYSKDIIK